MTDLRKDVAGDLATLGSESLHREVGSDSSLVYWFI